MIKKIKKKPIMLLFFWAIISIVSINHIQQLYEEISLPISVLGWLWLGFIFSLFIYLAKHNLKEVLGVFFTFFLLGFLLGAYLEPPSDPLEHLRRVYSYCGLSSFDISRENRGLWHYSLSSLFLCSPQLTQTPSITLYTIDFLHGLYLGGLVTALFLVAKGAGLSSRWSFFAALTGFLFFGTNRFGYFSYYTLAASASSMLIYWLWVSKFFFKRDKKNIIIGTLFAVSFFPVLLVNHKQEAAFLILVFCLWISLNGHEWIWERFNGSSKKSVATVKKLLYVFIVFIVLFVLPRYLDLDDIFDVLEYNWKTNQYLLKEVFSFYHVGHFIEYRVGDSLGIMGFLPAFLTVPFILARYTPFSLSQRIRIVFLSSLPLIVLFVPLLNFFWLSSIHAATATSVHWRIVYSTFFWLMPAALLFSLEKEVLLAWSSKKSAFLRVSTNQYWRSILVSQKWFALCLLVLIILSSIRTTPVYGKLDFALVNSRGWWDNWKPMIEELTKVGKPIYTDDVTSVTLHSVFDYDVAHVYLKSANYRPLGRTVEKVDIQLMNKQQDYACLVNLKGFNASWVPSETGHWSPALSDTASYYQYNGLFGKQLSDRLNTESLDKCLVYK